MILEALIQKLMNEYVVGIILWLGWTFRTLNTLLVLIHYLSFSDFQLTQLWPSYVGSSRHLSVSIVAHQDSSLIQAICLTTLFSRFPFFTTYLDADSLSSLGMTQYTLLGVRIESSKRQYNSQIFWIWFYLLMFDYLPPIKLHW